MRYFVFLFLLALVSCSVEKRRYTGGFYVDFQTHRTAESLKNYKPRVPEATTSEDNYARSIMVNESVTAVSVSRDPVMPHLKVKKFKREKFIQSAKNSVSSIGSVTALKKKSAAVSDDSVGKRKFWLLILSISVAVIIGGVVVVMTSSIPTLGVVCFLLGALGLIVSVGGIITTL